MAKKSEHIFFAEAIKGYTFKVTIDSLAIAMPRTVFNVTKEGFFCRAADEPETILYDIAFPRENFRVYKCFEKKLSFSLNLKHLQKMVRNVKKKDAIVIFIEEDKPDRLYVAIKASNLSSGHNSRIETLFVTITRENEDVSLGLPEVYTNEKGKEIKVYGFPKTIDASDFQKMKKMTTLGKLVKVSMQEGNYISFCSDNGKLYGSNLEFGEITKNVDIMDDEEQTPLDENEDPAEKETSVEECFNSQDIKGLYDADFHMNIFSLLMKLPGLCKLMNFYSPRIPRYPLKIQMNAENLGHITVYIKDAIQIAYEQSERERKERKEREKRDKEEKAMHGKLTKRGGKKK